VTRLLCASIFAIALCSLFHLNTANSQEVTIQEINPTHSNIGGLNATGGRVNHLGRATDSIIYAASEFGGLFKSTDAGRTWTRLDNHLPTRVSDVKVSPSDPNLVVATSLFDGRISSFAGINVSHDGGLNWTKPPSTIPPAGFCGRPEGISQPSAFGIAFDPQNGTHVFVGTNCGLAKSIDGGLNWTFINPGPRSPADIVAGVAVHDGGIIDTCGFGGHRRSIDDGQTWTGARPGGTPLPAAAICSIAPSPFESSVIFATAGPRIFESDDAGGSWNTEFANPKSSERVPFVVVNRRQGRNFDLWFGDADIFRATCSSPLTPSTTPRCPPSNTWTVTGTGAHADMGEVVFTNPPPIDPNICSQDCTNAKTACDDDCAADNRICTSQVGKPGGPLASQCAQQLKACKLACTNEFNTCNTNCNRFPEGCPIVLACDGGTYINTVIGSPACQTPKWIQSDVTTRGLWLWSLSGANIPDSPVGEALYMAAQDDGTFATLNAGAATPTWVNPDAGDASDTVSDTTQVLYTDCCFGAPRDNKVFRRNPGMRGGRQIPNYPPGDVPGFFFPDVITRFGFSSFAMITTKGIFATQNIAANPIIWTPVGNAPHNACALAAVGPQTNPTFYALDGMCSGFAGDFLRFKGTSTTGNWQVVPLPPGGFGVGIFAVDPNNANRLFASIFTSTGPHMFRSLDGGTTWTADTVLDGLMTGNGTFLPQVAPFVADPYPQPTLVAFDPDNSNNLLAGAADAGIFLSRDNGVTWKTITNNSGDAANPIIPRPHWAYFDRECSQYNIYVGTQGRGAWHLSYPDPEGSTVVECQGRCQTEFQQCQKDCATERDLCQRQGGKNCGQEARTCSAICVGTRNTCNQHCVDCPQ